MTIFCDSHRKYIICVIVLMYHFALSNAIYIRAIRNRDTYASYPKWNACVNATFSFEFRTTQSTGVLMYMDDGGRFDFFDVQLSNGKARLRLNIVDGRDGSVEFELGSSLNDNQWHKVSITRNRMETTFSVDKESSRKLSYGSDFYFGNTNNNSDIFFGGLPGHYRSSLPSLALPSVLLMGQRMTVEIRNVIYGNCTCEHVRGSLIDGVEVDPRRTEACEQRDPCGDCLCISTDSGPTCNCNYKNKCQIGTFGVFYHLPMNILLGTSSLNPSGLDAEVKGNPRVVRGAKDKALRIDGRRQQLQVSGPGHRYECFGDLDLCSNGYTLGLWLKFEKAGNTKGVYLSNGGHNAQSHGVAMLYKAGRIEFVLKKKDGKYWNVKYNNVFENRWYHVLVTWKETLGAKLYINGNFVAQDTSVQQRAALLRRPRHNDFIIGRPQDRRRRGALGVITVDELKFWSEYKDEYQVRELGPMYKYEFDMDQIEGRELIVTNAGTEVIGNVRTVPGKIRNGIQFYKDGGNIDVGDFAASCLGDPSLCIHGFTIAFWLKLNELRQYSYFFSSKGLSIFTVGTYVHAEVFSGDKKWADSFDGLLAGTWHYVEVSWNQEKGLSMFLDLQLMTKQVSHLIEKRGSNADDKFYIGRANNALQQEFPSAIVDEVEMLYGERDTLLYLDLIQRGKPTKYFFGLDKMMGDRLLHPALMIDTYNNPKTVNGKIGNAIKLNGERQVVDFGEVSTICLGNLDLCPHGVMVAMWFRPENFQNDMYFFSSGHNGITIQNKNNNVEVSAATSTKLWTASTDVLFPDEWYFIEISWDPEKGIHIYVNNNEVANDERPTSRDTSTPPGFLGQSTENKMYLGRGNVYMETGTYGKAMYDELEYWYGPRDYLIAFGYIQRGKPESHLIDMDSTQGDVINVRSLTPRMFGSARLVPGVIGNALSLDGNNQYVDIGDLRNECLGNLYKCSNGLTISSWINFQRYEDNMYIFSTGNNGVRMYQKGGNIHASVQLNGKEWNVEFPRVDTGFWNYVELSWHPDFGLKMYLNNTLVAEESTFKNVPVVPNQNKRVYIGRANPGDSTQSTRTANLLMDELETWYGRREEMLAFDYIVRDNIQHETFSMETANNGQIVHPLYTINLANGAQLAPGIIGSAVNLNGYGQYVDLGNHGDKCMGNLNKCKHGLTISLWLKARQLEDGTYFLSSPSYSLSYKDGQLIARFNANGKMWEASTPNIRADRWHQVVMSWSPDEGISLFIDGRQEAFSSAWSSFQGDDPNTSSVYIGRSSTDTAKTIKGSVDEVRYIYGTFKDALAAGQLEGYVNHQALPLSRVVRVEDGKSQIVLPSRTITLYGGATRSPGQHGGAIRINGKSQYLDLGDDLICNGNLKNCESRGFTVRFSARPERLLENMYFLDSFPLSVYYRGGKLYATARTPTKSWTVSSSDFKAGEWQLVEITWQPQRGLTMFLNGVELAHQTFGTPQTEVLDWSRRTYFGRSLSDMIRERYADAVVERLDVWNVQKDYLEMHGIVRPDSSILNRGRTDTTYIRPDDINRVVLFKPSPIPITTATPRPTYAPFQTPPPRARPPVIIKDTMVIRPNGTLNRNTVQRTSQTNVNTIIIRANGTLNTNRRTSSRQTGNRNTLFITANGTMVRNPDRGIDVRDNTRVVVDSRRVVDDREIMIIDGFEARVVRKGTIDSTRVMAPGMSKFHEILSFPDFSRLWLKVKVKGHSYQCRASHADTIEDKRRKILIPSTYCL